jgi:RHS repeat-associated protein
MYPVFVRNDAPSLAPRVYLFLAAVVLLILPAVPLRAQQYLNEIGLPPFTTIEPTENGVINLANGNVHVEISLGTYPQRGGPSLTLTPRFVYDSRIWSIVNNGTSQVWSPSYTAAGWQNRMWGFPIGAGYNQNYVPCGASGYWVYSNYSFTEANGTTHSFPVTTGQDGSPPSGCNIPPSTATAYASDSSGFMIVAHGFTGDNATVYYPDGTQYDYSAFYGAYYTKDSNGNQVLLTDNPSIQDTLGRTVVYPDVSGNGTWYASNSQGTYSGYSVQTTTVSVATHFGVPGVTEYSGSISAIQSITLPDGSSYQFQYNDPYGELSAIILPTGGQITFTYSNFKDAYGNTNRWVTGRSSSAGSWSYTPQVISTCGAGQQNCQQTVTATNPNGEYSVYTFTLNGGAWPVQVKRYNGSGTLMLTSTKTYDLSQTCSGCTGAAYVRLTQQNDTLPSSGGTTLNKQTQYSYDSIYYGNVTAAKEWKFYTGSPGSTPDRETDTTYLVTAPYITNNIINRPTSITVKNASGGQVSQTLFTYDSTALSSVTGIVNHDDALYGAGNTIRGNPTVVQQWVSGSTYLSSTLAYDTTGQVPQATDSKGNTTTVGYNDFYFNDGGSSLTAYTPPGPTHAYATSITKPLIGTSTYGYYFGSGQRALATDENGATSYFHYFDGLDRPTQTTDAAGGWSLTSYTSPTQADFYTGITATSPTTSCSGSNCRHDEQLLDSLGRLQHASLVSDPDGQTTTDYGYDFLSRLTSASNAHRSSSSPTDGTTLTGYDALGRTISITRPDNNIVSYAYGSALSSAVQQCSSASFGIGYPKVTTDETGRQRQYWIDGFGQAIEVDEPNSSGALTVASCYQYTALGALTMVQQTGGTSSTYWRTRTYAVDGLSRVTQEVTPEDSPNGTQYNYSSSSPCSGNPRLPCTRTDARGIVTTYTYDALNRLTGKSYSDGTAAVHDYYDQTSYNGLTITNGKGRRTGVSDGSGSTAWSYNAVGRVATRRQTIGSLTKAINYSYNGDGSIASITYPSGRVLSYSYSTAQRPILTTDGTTKFVSQVTYTPPAALSTAIFGAVTGWNAVTETLSYNNRLQFTGILATTPVPSTLINLSYSYNQGGGKNNGDVVQITNNLDSTRTAIYSYDLLNRIYTAATTVWGDQYGIDAWGNLLSKTVTVGTAENLSVQVNTKNQVSTSGFQYDAAGNLKWDGFNALNFDAEQRANPASGDSYLYDGDSRRVQKASGMTYWMGDDRNPLSVSDNSGNIQTDYIYFGGQRVALVEGGNPYYYLGDHLGSARVISSGDGKAKMWDADYYPYGTLRLVTNNLTNYYQFTGYEHDYGTGYNNANFRYQSTTLGRFMSPDRVDGQPSDPQTWNRYAYVANRPLSATDPLGLDLVSLIDEGGGGGGGCGLDGAGFAVCFIGDFPIYLPTDSGDSGSSGAMGSGRPTPVPRGPGPRPIRPPENSIPTQNPITVIGSDDLSPCGLMPCVPVFNATGSLNIDLSGQAGWWTSTLSFAIAIDSHLCVAWTTTVGSGPGFGGRTSVGGSVSTSDAAGVSDLGGPFSNLNLSIGGPVSIGGSVFTGPSPHGQVTGTTAGASIGLPNPLPVSGSATVTSTTVHRIGNCGF